MQRFLSSLAAAACAAALGAGPAAGAIIISEYVEGSSNNKAIELYNTGPAPVSLSGYALKLYFNGSTSAGQTLALSGSLGAGQTWVIANSTGSDPLRATADQLWAFLSFNGNDSVALLSGSAFVDVIGQIGSDPGVEWGAGLQSTQDNTLRRSPVVVAGDANPFDAFDPAQEWIGLAVDTFDGLGTHTTSVPEPAALILLCVGLTVLARLSRNTGPHNDRVTGPNAWARSIGHWLRVCAPKKRRAGTREAVFRRCQRAR